ncbi:MAG: altronate dehydratase [Clostridia bacterium]|nr:altronate dehydratase [Clostridia bacterium]
MQIHPNDNVEIRENGHKYALSKIEKGQDVIKYGFPIGVATCDIEIGEHVHTHNVKTKLSGNLEYTYKYKDYGIEPVERDLYFEGYVRENGDVGIRNEIWIVNTVGCVNKIAEALAKRTGAKCFTHPYGCSQLGDDHALTQKILCAMIKHPNAGGVLVLGLGCENNNIKELKKVLGPYNEKRVRFLNTQDVENELEVGEAIINELFEYANSFKRERVHISKLKIGLKCGGSDGLSGISANPLVGRICDKLVSYGGSCVLTEVPEMFGAEHLLMERCVSREIFDKAVLLINNFKDYFTRHNQVIYENPSPGNKEGGITTLEEKSLGCVQKGGLSPVVDVLDYGDTITKNGLSLLNGPGNDIVAITNLMASGAVMILFTTGRGTPLGGAVPTVKISTNSALAKKKANWIDFDASIVLDKVSMDQGAEMLLSYIVEIANGKQAKNEENGFAEIAIFKDGVTL